MDSLKSALLALFVKLGFIHKPSFVVLHVSDHPSPAIIQQGFIYVVGYRGHSKWAYVRNPADSSEIIQLSLMQNRRPCWQVSGDIFGRATVFPSVRQLEGSFAHFWIRKGGIIWCEDTGRPPLRAEASHAPTSHLPPDLTA